MLSEESAIIKGFFTAAKFNKAFSYLIDRTTGKDDKIFLQTCLLYSLYKIKDYANSKKIAFHVLEEVETK